MRTRAQILGENLKRIRIEKNITRKQLAELLQVSQSAITYYENGKMQPPLEKIFDMADYLQVSLASLIGENNFSDNIPNVESTIEDKLFECRLQRAYKMARDFLDYESNRKKNFDSEGHIVIYSPKKIVYEGNGVFSYKGGINAIAFKSADDFIKVMEQAEELALKRGIYFNLAFRELVFNETTYRVLDSDFLDKPLL